MTTSLRFQTQPAGNASRRVARVLALLADGVPQPCRPARAQACFYPEIQVWTGELDATLAEPADPQNKAPRGGKKFSDPVRYSSAKL